MKVVTFKLQANAAEGNEIRKVQSDRIKAWILFEDIQMLIFRLHLNVGKRSKVRIALWVLIYKRPKASSKELFLYGQTLMPNLYLERR